MKLRDWREREMRRNPAFAAASAEIDFVQSIADKLVDARIAAGLTQGELAARANTTQARISEMEAGDGNPTAETIVKVFAALGLSPRMVIKPIGAEQTGKAKLEVASTSTEDIGELASASYGSVAVVGLRGRRTNRRTSRRPTNPSAYKVAAYAGIDRFAHGRELVLA